MSALAASALPSSFAASTSTRQAPEQARHQLGDFGALFGAADIAELPHQRVGQRQVSFVIGDEASRRRRSLIEQRPPTPRAACIGALDELHHLVVEDQDQKVVLRPGVGEERPCRDAGGLGDLLRGRGLEPLVGEQSPRRGDDAAALLDLVLLSTT